MKLILNNSNRQYSRHYGKKLDVGTVEPSKFIRKNKNDDISFTSLGKFSKIISKKTGEVIYTNAHDIIENIDKTFGKKFFSNLLENAHIAPVRDNLVIQNRGFFRKTLDSAKKNGTKGFFGVIGDSLSDIPARIAITFANLMKKVSPLKKFGEDILATNFIKKKEAQFNVKKSYDMLTDILEEFSSKKLITNSVDKFHNDFSINNSTEYLKNVASNGITKVVKNYSTRDERTVNRLATGVVSSIFGGWDFYNLSMIQKDDKNEAKKAQKKRFFVELKKYVTSAGFTFLTLGALNKYIKDSMALNVLAIIGSSIISEIFSKITSGTPIIPLTPEKAKAIAQKRKSKPKSEISFSQAKTKNIALKGHKEIIPRERQVFGKFFSKDGSFAPLNVLNNQYLMQQKEAPKKKNNLIKVLGLGFGIASTVYLVSCALKGEFKFNKGIKEIYDKNADKIDEFLSGKTKELDKNVLNKLISEVDAFNKKRSDFGDYDIFSKIKERFTMAIKKASLDELAEMKDRLAQLAQTPEGEGAREILNKYIKDLDKIMSKNKPFKIVEKEYKIRAGFYNGLTKLPKTLYQIFSLPGLGIKTLLNSTVFKKSNDAYKKIDSITEIGKKMRDEISEIYGLINKKDLTDDKIIKELEKKVKRISVGPETGELANYARTCVTFISSLFFINDYRNQVLIESEGKDTKKASEEVSTRVSQKISNFIINGTLMNLFNSIFKTPLNKSLFGATWVPALTEVTNETLTRKFIFQPILPKNSKQEIIDFEAEQNSKEGLAGWWNKTYKKLTNKKSLTEKAGIKK